MTLHVEVAGIILTDASLGASSLVCMHVFGCLLALPSSNSVLYASALRIPVDVHSSKMVLA